VEVVTYRWIAEICRRELHMAGCSLRAGTEYRWASTIMLDIGRQKPLAAYFRVSYSGANYQDWMRRGLDRPYSAAKAVVERAISRIEGSIKVEVPSGLGLRRMIVAR
jgi:hypothetical protein